MYMHIRHMVVVDFSITKGHVHTFYYDQANVCLNDS